MLNSRVLGMLAISSASIVDGFCGLMLGLWTLLQLNIFLGLFGFALMLAIGTSVVAGKLIGER